MLKPFVFTICLSACVSVDQSSEFAIVTFSQSRIDRCRSIFIFINAQYAITVKPELTVKRTLISPIGMHASVVL